MKSLSSVVRSLFGAGRMILNKSYALRHIRNKWRYPALECDPTVNFSVQGEMEYAPSASLGPGCNVMVPKGAKLILGKGSSIGRFVELGAGPLIEIGDGTSIQDRCVILGRVRFGRYCVLSYDIYISSGQHIFDRKPHMLIRDQDREFGGVGDGPSQDGGQVIVEDDVWIGVHAVLMRGVTIGRGCVIGANAVVTHSLPPYSVAAGCPARVLRKRLEFGSPAEINWQKDDDIPYFYRGFETSVDELQRHAHLGGHLAESDFALWLNRGPGNKICICARGLSDDQAVIERKGQSRRLSVTWMVYEFDDDTEDGARISPTMFSVTGGPVVVTGAWTK
jgi:acetyltransferase-like isoleucine patch superfamily enzyme